MPRSSRPLTVHPVSLREVEVSRVTDLTPGMRRITLTGSQLKAFTSDNGLEQPGFVSSGFDDDIRLVFPYPGEHGLVLPTQAEGHLDWPKDPRPLAKVYSVRRWDAETGELEVDFVKHGIGTATTWAYRATPGDRIHFFGPHASAGLPAHADWLLVAGDDTALPAIGRLLEELPTDARGQVFIEIAEHSHIQHLPELPGVTVTWLVRDGAEAGTTTLLLDAVRAAQWWEGEPFAWVAGEQSTVRDVRRHLVDDRGMPKEDITFVGYWKRSEVTALADDAAVPDPEHNTNAFEEFHDLAELVPPIAIRVAAGLGLGDLISRGFTDVAALAKRTSSDERALGKLLRYLHSIDLLTETERGQYGLTETGEFLANEFWAEMLDPQGVAGRMEAGIYGLAESIRTGKAAYPRVTGKAFTQVREEQSYEDAYLEQTARAANFLAGPLANSQALDGVEHLVIRSAGAGVEAREITRVHPGIRVTISVLATQADWLTRDLPESIPDPAQRDRISVIEQTMLDPAPAAEAVLIVKALTALADTEAATALRAAAANLHPGGRVLLIEDTFGTHTLDEHDGEADLLALARDGTGLRTEAELHTVIAAANLRVDGSHTIGWGHTIHVLTSPSPHGR